MGKAVPDFELPNQFGEPVRLSGLSGTSVAVVFFPFAFSSICTTELTQLEDNAAWFEDSGVRILAVSTDHKYALRAFARTAGLGYDLLADFWPHGAVAAAYGVLDAAHGFAGRTTFFVDGNRILRHTVTAEPGQGRRLEEYQAALTHLDQPGLKQRSHD